MNESTTKKRNNYNLKLIRLLTDKHKVSVRFVYHALSEERTSKLAIQIKEEYTEMIRIINKKEKEAISIINKKIEL